VGVVYVKELWDSRTATGTLKRQRTYTRKFEVKTDDPYDGPIIAANAEGLPRLGDFYLTPNEADSGSFCKSVTPDNSAEDPTLWYFTAQYDSNLDTQGSPQEPGKEQQKPKDRPENPLNRPPIWKFGFRHTQRPALKDKDGNPIVNKAGFPFDPPIMEDVSYLTISITTNRAVWWADKAEPLMRSVNKKAWFTLPARTVKVVGVEAGGKWENNFGYWEVTFNLEVNRDTWDEVVLNAGFQELVFNPATAQLEPQKILDKFGKEPTAPYPLTMTGSKMPVGGTPEYLTFRVKQEIDYNGVIP
jgi:hypothetical protein